MQVHKTPRAQRHPSTRGLLEEHEAEMALMSSLSDEVASPVTVVCLSPAPVKPKPLPNVTPAPFQLDVVGGKPHTVLSALPLSLCPPASNKTLVQPGNILHAPCLCSLPLSQETILYLLPPSFPPPHSYLYDLASQFLEQMEACRGQLSQVPQASANSLTDTCMFAPTCHPPYW